MALRGLPPLPFEDEGLMRRSLAALDLLAEAYEHGGEASWTRFLFGFVPLRLLGGLLGEDARPVPPPGFLLALYASGVVGGWWLRRALRRAQPDGPLATLAAKPDRAALEAALQRSYAAEDAAAGDDDAALTHAEGALPRHAASFGYNLGYLLEISESVPETVLERPSSVTERGLLDVELGPRALPLRPELKQAVARLAAPEGRWEALSAMLAPVQEAECARGRQVWSSGLSVRGLDATTYTELVEVSAAFLEVAQATALTAAWAVAERDAEAARRAALADAGISPWLAGYALGLLDPAHDEADPPPWPSLELPAR